MASASIYISNQPYDDGTIPIFLRFIVNRKIYLKQLWKVEEGYIDRKKKQIRNKYVYHNKVNQLINNSLADAKEYILDCNIKKIPVDPVAYFNEGKAITKLSLRIEAKRKKLEGENRFRTAAKLKTLFMKVTDSKMDTPINQINRSWIERFDAWMKKGGNNPNTRAKYLGTIGAILNEAVREGSLAANPFNQYIKPSNDSNKAKLNMTEFRAFQTVDVTGNEASAKDLFIFATLARGMRAFDVLTLKWTDVKNGRIVYHSQKSTHNKTGKSFDIRITDQIQAVLDRQVKKGPYIFPFVKILPEMYKKNPERYLRTVNSANTLVNKYIDAVAKKASIDKHVTLHVARHSYAFISDQKNVPAGTIQRLLGHSKLSTTLGYVQSLRNTDELDEAAEDLF